MELANRKKTKLGIILYSNDPFEICLKTKIFDTTVPFSPVKKTGLQYLL